MVDNVRLRLGRSSQTVFSWHESVEQPRSVSSSRLADASSSREHENNDQELKEEHV